MGRSFVPAAGHGWALPFYDPIVKLLGVDALRERLIEYARIRPGHRVLDIGCGTGTLVVRIKRLHPDAEVVGLDPDPKALARGRRKAERAAVSVRFDLGFSDDLPYPDASFDRVVSSFMLHHLEPGEKKATLHQVRRVLKPGGILHLLDFGGAGSPPHGFLARLLHVNRRLRDNFEGRIGTLMTHTGFADAREVGQASTLIGQASHYQACAR